MFQITASLKPDSCHSGVASPQEVKMQTLLRASALIRSWSNTLTGQVLCHFRHSSVDITRPITSFAPFKFRATRGSPATRHHSRRHATVARDGRNDTLKMRQHFTARSRQPPPAPPPTVTSPREVVGGGVGGVGGVVGDGVHHLQWAPAPPTPDAAPPTTPGAKKRGPGAAPDVPLGTEKGGAGTEKGGAGTERERGRDEGG